MGGAGGWWPGALLEAGEDTSPSARLCGGSDFIGFGRYIREVKGYQPGN